jgi:homoserine dehydrogenase
LARCPGPKWSSSTALDATTRRVGIFGGGTVGGGICQILDRKRPYLEQLTGGTTHIEIVKLVVRDLKKQRDFDVPQDCVVTDNYQDILQDDSIDMVVEVMGGTTDAKTVVFSALKAGKDVVTANKGKFVFFPVYHHAVFCV